jgi:mannose-6-phosphate isomerase-like protein (cupin superfamily)
MRIALLLGGLLTAGTLVAAQAPAPSTPAPRPAQPAAPQAPATTPAPAPRRPAAPSPAVTARTGVAIMVTDSGGQPIGGVRVTISGPSERSGTTGNDGVLRVTGLQVGTYRLRFTGETVITFEREVAVRAGQTGDIDVVLTAAPPSPPPPPPPPAPVVVEPKIGPAGTPAAPSLLDFLSRNAIRNNEPRRETLISCSGNTRATLVQMNENQPQRLYADAEVTYYIIQGDGTLRAAGKEAPLGQGSFISMPRGVGHEIVRNGRRPLVMVATVSGEPCEVAK